MLELVVVGIVAAAVAVFAVASSFGLVTVGMITVLFGLLVGFPASVGYHLRLRSALLRHAELAPRWWLNPTAMHNRLDESQFAPVRPWLYAGAISFTLCVLASFAVVADLLAMG